MEKSKILNNKLRTENKYKITKTMIILTKNLQEMQATEKQPMR
jgi:hypothetical protein